ncbi:hypothetical protein QX249_12850 [Vibrio parahaemolyticus]|uniref:Conjugal transfer protein TraD n=1 Tax=Vibrio parahaemolyticus TaxID=670 RepID=A0AAW8Q1L7_VIBPH|nr:hypothetical protein [Vibrio parahaemolyticus]MDS1821554.1 hypothetical protein [Vibrio parahaemolyticus]
MNKEIITDCDRDLLNSVMANDIDANDEDNFEGYISHDLSKSAE